MEIFYEITDALNENKSFALATVVETDGSTPRHPGSKMIVFEDGSFCGTVGGGAVEKKTIQTALECLKNGHPFLLHHSIEIDNAKKGMNCAGNMSIFIEPMNRKPQLVICGAGHVAGMLIPLAKSAGFRVSVIDTRGVDVVGVRVKEADEFIDAATFGDAVASIDSADDTFFLVCTFAHTLDCQTLKVILNKKSAYIGMLGGPEKKKAIFDILRQDGVSDEKLMQIYTPVGLDIGGETPAEIAIAVAAELIMVKNHATGKPLQSKTSG